MNIAIPKEKILARPQASGWMPYAFVIMFCLGLESILLGLGWTDLGVPYLYFYDYLYFSATVKGVLEQGWFLHNPNLGAPGALASYDYTDMSVAHFLMIKCIALFTSDWAKAINLFYVVSFPLAAVSSLMVFRHFNIPSPVAVTGSLLFAFAPYHFLRLLHIVYTNYFFVPFVTLVLLWIVNDKLKIVRRDINSGRWRFDFRSGISLASILIAVLVSGFGVYYAFFSCFFLVIAGGMAFLNKRNAEGLLTSWILIGVICAGVALQMVPAWVYKMNHGSNPLVTLSLKPVEVENHGMKIAQLLLPVTDHRIASWAKLREWYDRTAPLVNENGSSSLGLAGSIGFLALLVGLFYRRGDPSSEDLEWPLARLNIGAVLLGTIGGFSSIFAYLINPQIRAYNRISIFIEFFAIFALVLLLAHVYKKVSAAGKSKLLGYALCGVVLVLGLLDQIPTSFKTPYSAIRNQFAEDATFFTRIEKSLPEHAMVFQLPYSTFPMSQPLNRMGPYEQIRGYLHTQNVRWSYGALNGRAAQAWQQSVSQLPAQAMVNALTIAGFKGIYLNQRGYSDSGREMITHLAGILKAQPSVTSAFGEVFFTLEPYFQQLRKQFSEEQWSALQGTVLVDPLALVGKELFTTSQIVTRQAGLVERVVPQSGGSRQQILIQGWAVDPETRMPAETLMVVHEGRASQLLVSQQEARPDIALKFEARTALRSQWSGVLDTRTWKPGKHTFEIFAVLKGNRLGRLGGCDEQCRVTLSPQ